MRGVTAFPEVPVLFEDSEVVVVDKPSGLLVTPIPGQGTEGTLVGWLLERYGSSIRSVGSEGHRPGIVHRLDRDTSGVMVCAKTQAAWESLVQQFKSRSVMKEYNVLVWGDIKEREFIIDAPILRNPRKRIKFIVAEGGREARTHFITGDHRQLIVEKGVTGAQHAVYTLSFLKSLPQTGRTHQIRVHLRAFGHPVVGDFLYQTRSQKEIIEGKGLRRIFLHATKLGFRTSGGFAVFDSPLPDKLQSFLESLPHAT